MQVIKSKTVVKLSMQELADAIRFYVDKTEGFWIDEFEIEVNGVDLISSIKSSAETVTEEDGWINVPEDWDKPACPFNIPSKGKVLFKFRCGEIDETNLEYDYTWVQDGKDYNIVAYKLI